MNKTQKSTNLDLTSNIPLYKQLADLIKEKYIINGQIDSRLPMFRALATEYQVSLKTVKKAFDSLKEEGLIHTRRGLGTVITKAPERLSLNIALFDVPGSSESRLIRNIISLFREKHKNIDVKQHWAPFADYEEMLDALEGTPDQPDIIWVNESAFLNVGHRRFRSVEGPVLEHFKHDCYTETGAMFKHRGKLWAVPVFFSPTVLLLSKAVFTAAGISIPDHQLDFQEFLELTERLSNPEKGIYGFGARIQLNRWANCLLAAGALVSHENDHWYFDCNGCEFVDSLRTLEHVYHARNGVTVINNVATLINVFNRGLLGMVDVSYFELGMFADSLKDSEMLLIPYPISGDGEYLLCGVGCGIASEANNLIAAQEFMNFMQSTENQRLIALSASGIPVVKEHVPDQLKYCDVTIKGFKAFESYMDKLIAMGCFRMNDERWDEVAAEIYVMLHGHAPLKEVVRASRKITNAVAV
jgi:multiple sugar transport system substrate-binding protein